MFIGGKTQDVNMPILSRSIFKSHFKSCRLFHEKSVILKCTWKSVASGIAKTILKAEIQDSNDLISLHTGWQSSGLCGRCSRVAIWINGPEGESRNTYLYMADWFWTNALRWLSGEVTAFSINGTGTIRHPQTKKKSIEPYPYTVYKN